MKGLILSAGLGSRLKPLTNDLPKPMVDIAGKPILEYLVDHLHKFNIKQIMVNVHYKPEKIMEYFGDKLIYIHEPILLGDIVSTRRIVNLVNDDLVVMNGDTLTDINIDKMNKVAYENETSVSSFEGMTYTGTTFFRLDYPNKIQLHEFGCYWQDAGTHEGLEAARKKYESEANLSKLL